MEEGDRHRHASRRNAFTFSHDLFIRSSQISALPLVLSFENRRNAMHLQIVNFNLKDMTDSGFRAMANEVAAAFATVPGLLGKIWLADVRNNTYGGVYIWQDAAAMQAYLASDMGKGVAGNPNFANLSSRD